MAIGAMPAVVSRNLRIHALIAALALGACSGGGPESALAAHPARIGAGSKIIYSDLGTGGKVYRCCFAWTIGGPHSKIGRQWIAAPFTPAADGSVTAFHIAVTWSLGPNAKLALALARDRRGLPGSDLATAAVPAGLPAFNHCCALQAVTLPSPAVVKAGVQYWVIVRTSGGTGKTVDNWQNNTTGAGGEVSSNDGTGWSNTHVGKGLPAFAVLGSD